MTVIERYQALKQQVIDRAEPFNKLMEHLENNTEWMIAPASTRFHLCRKGGLLEHSVNVAETLVKIKDLLCSEISDESCIIVGLLHDLGKAGVPGTPQYIPNEPTERQKQYGYPASTPYRFNTDLTYLSVPARSLYLVLPYLSLSEDEAQAILYHDGQYVEDNRSVAAKEGKLTLLLHYADNWNGFIVEEGMPPGNIMGGNMKK